MNTGRSPRDDDEDDEDQSPDVSDSIHEIENEFEFKSVPIDEAEAEAEAEAGGESKSESDTQDEPIRAPFADFQYEPYSIAENGPPVCPLCGQQLSMVRIDGPETAVVSPCGCRMPPDPFFESSGERY